MPVTLFPNCQHLNLKLKFKIKTELALPDCRITCLQRVECPPSRMRREQGLKERYERHHQCIYDFDALEAAVALSSRYVADRFLPDKVWPASTSLHILLCVRCALLGCQGRPPVSSSCSDQ